MNEKISPCFRCSFHTKPLLEDGHEKFVEMIKVFGSSVETSKELSNGKKDEILGLLNGIICSYPSSRSIQVIFDPLSNIIKSNILYGKNLSTIWGNIIKIVRKDITTG